MKDKKNGKRSKIRIDKIKLNKMIFKRRKRPIFKLFFFRKRYKIFLLFIPFLICFYPQLSNYNIEYINNYIIPKYVNFSYNNTIQNKLKIGIYTGTLKGGGRARMTAILLNYLVKIKYLLIVNNKKKNMNIQNA